MVYRFEGFELDSERHELRHEGARIVLQPKVLKLVLHLVRHRERVVGREELFRELWPDAIVSEDALFHALKKARAAVGDDGASQRIIETVPRVGYRFVVEVEEGPAPQPREEGRPPSAGEPAAEASAASPTAGLVGRGGELAALRKALGAALAGSGRVVLLSGEAGIGKSRLVRELAETARERGAEVKEALAWQGPGAPPFWVWVQLLRACAESWDDARLGRTLGEGAREIARLVPALRERFGLEASGVRDGDEARFLQMDAIARFFVRASRDRPLVLVLEDLHWAPPAALQMLAFLAGELDGTRILVLATRRESQAKAGEALEAAVAACAQRDVLVPLRLEGLSASEVGDLVAQVAGFPPSQELAGALHEETGGNPFFVREVAALAAGEEDGEASLEARVAGPRSALPEGVRRVLASRLAGLSPACADVLAAGSVVGRLPLTVLAQVLALPRPQLLEALDEALAAQLIERESGAEPAYRFSHALVREAAYASLSEPERVALHRRVGEALEILHAGHLEPVVPSLAHHYGVAALLVEGTRAVDYAKWAGDLAVEALSIDEAAEHYERARVALDLLPHPGDDRRRAEVLVCLGFALQRAGEGERGREAHHQAAVLAQRAGDAGLLAFAALGFAELGVTVVDPEPVRLLEEALAARGDRGDILDVWLRSALALHRVNHRGGGAAAAALVEEAEARARALGDGRALGGALTARAHVLRVVCELPEERLPLLQEAARLLRESGDRTLELLNWAQLRGVWVELGDLEAARVANMRVERLLSRVRSRDWSYLAAGTGVLFAMLEGRFADAEASAKQGFAGVVGPRFSASVLAAMLGVIRHEEGQLGELLPLLDQLADALADLPALVAARALALLETGDRAGAQRLLDELAAHRFRDVATSDNGVMACAVLAELCARLGDVERARWLRAVLEPRAGHWVCLSNGFYTHGPVALHLGVLACACEDWEVAERELERALQSAEELGAPLWQAHALAAQVRLCRGRNGRGDARRAEAVGKEARVIAERLGMRRLRRELDTLDR